MKTTVFIRLVYEHEEWDDNEDPKYKERIRDQIDSRIENLLDDATHYLDDEAPSKVERALEVLVTDKRIRFWLTANDPKALAQAADALLEEGELDDDRRALVTLIRDGAKSRFAGVGISTAHIQNLFVGSKPQLPTFGALVTPVRGSVCDHELTTVRMDNTEYCLICDKEFGKAHCGSVSAEGSPCALVKHGEDVAHLDEFGGTWK